MITTTPRPTSDILAEVLHTAADLLERDGWVRAQSGPRRPEAHGPRCLYGAISAACNPSARLLPRDYPILSLAYHAALEAIGAVDYHLAFTWPSRLSFWNDAVCPDQAAAVTVLRTAATAAGRNAR